MASNRPERLEELQERHGEWHLWTSQRGTMFCATRRGRLDPVALRQADLSRTIIADSIDELAESLAEEAQRESRC